MQDTLSRMFDPDHGAPETCEDPRPAGGQETRRFDDTNTSVPRPGSAARRNSGRAAAGAATRRRSAESRSFAASGRAAHRHCYSTGDRSRHSQRLPRPARRRPGKATIFAFSPTASSRKSLRFSSEAVPLSAVVLLDNDLDSRVATQVQKSLISIAAGFGPRRRSRARLLRRVSGDCLRLFLQQRRALHQSQAL